MTMIQKLNFSVLYLADAFFQSNLQGENTSNYHSASVNFELQQTKGHSFEIPFEI